ELAVGRVRDEELLTVRREGERTDGSRFEERTARLRVRRRGIQDRPGEDEQDRSQQQESPARTRRTSTGAGHGGVPRRAGRARAGGRPEGRLAPFSRRPG